MRLDGWERRLHQVIEDARARPYVLGEHDCFRLACRVIEALTGIDRWPHFAGYRDKREALQLLARHGSSFEVAFDWFFGADARRPMRMARRGDICCLETADGQKHLGICLDVGVALLAPGGLIFVPTQTCLCCWGVG